MKYYTLSDGYTGIARQDDWIVKFPPWFDSSYELNSNLPLWQRWNSRSFACAHFAGRAVGSPKPDFPIVLGEWQAASRRLRSTLSELAPEVFEFLPFRTRNSIGEDVCEDYSLMHYTQWVDAVDRRASTLLEGETRFRRVGGQFGNFLMDRVVLAKKKLTQPICRIVGWTPYHVYREDIVEAIDRAGLTGLCFEEIETS